jgi:hypothetical protein
MAETLYWVDADGTAWPLDTDQSQAETPTKGRLGPSWTTHEDEYAQGNGGAIDDVSAGLRTWTFSFSLFGLSDDDLKDLRDEWQWRLNPERGDGAIRSVRSDGTTRDFVGRYVKGFDDAEESPETGLLANAQLSTTIHIRGGPFWRSTAHEPETFDTSSLRRLWFPMEWPWGPTPSTIWADRIVSNGGLHPSDPIWTIVGPGSGLVLTNRTTQEQFSLNYTIEPNEIITLDMRVPGNKTVTSSYGLDLIGETDGHMWALDPRDNDIAITLGGADDTSGVELVWPEYFDGP